MAQVACPTHDIPPSIEFVPRTFHFYYDRNPRRIYAGMYDGFTRNPGRGDSDDDDCEWNEIEEKEQKRRSVMAKMMYLFRDYDEKIRKLERWQMRLREEQAKVDFFKKYRELMNKIAELMAIASKEEEKATIDACTKLKKERTKNNYDDEIHWARENIMNYAVSIMSDNHIPWAS